MQDTAECAVSPSEQYRQTATSLRGSKCICRRHYAWRSILILPASIYPISRIWILFEGRVRCLPSSIHRLNLCSYCESTIYIISFWHLICWKRFVAFLFFNFLLTKPISCILVSNLHGNVNTNMYTLMTVLYVVRAWPIVGCFFSQTFRLHRTFFRYTFFSWKYGWRKKKHQRMDHDFLSWKLKQSKN